MFPKIDRFTIRNYRSCQKSTFTPDSRLSVLIGPNGSGKSNLLQALLLVRKLARKSRVPHSQNPSGATCALQLDMSLSSRYRVRLNATVDYDTDEKNADSITRTSERWQITLPQKTVLVKGPLLSAFQRPLHWNVLRHLYGIQTDRRSDIELLFRPNTRRLMESLYRFLFSMTYYSASQFTDPQRCPVSFELDEDKLSTRYGYRHSAHAEFLYDLYRASKEKVNGFKEYKSIVGKHGMRLIDDIGFKEIRTPSEVLEVRIGGRLLPRPLNIEHL